MSKLLPPVTWSRLRARSTWRFWSNDWSLSVLLLLLIVNIFALPLSLLYTWGRVVSRAIVALVLLSGLHATVPSRRLLVSGAVITLAALVVGLEAALRPSPWLHLLDDITALPMLGLLIMLILRQVFRAGPITPHRIRGSVAVYLLIGLIWAIGFDLLEAVSPGSFAASGAHRAGLGMFGYYSFTTLTTLGVGDVLPIKPMARSLTILEALTGQLFPAILIGRLVSMEISYRREGTGEE